jgi:hypothetical protein
MMWISTWNLFHANGNDLLHHNDSIAYPRAVKLKVQTLDTVIEINLLIYFRRIFCFPNGTSNLNDSATFFPETFSCISFSHLKCTYCLRGPVKALARFPIYNYYFWFPNF